MKIRKGNALSLMMQSDKELTDQFQVAFHNYMAASAAKDHACADAWYQLLQTFKAACDRSSREICQVVRS